MDAARIAVVAAALLTVGVLIAWLATGRHAYTAYQAVEEREVAVAGDDPLAATGFYEDEVRTERVMHDVFHFGLLPTPQGLLDKHGLSVLSVTLPAWAAAVGLVLLRRRREKRSASYAAVRA